MEKSKKLMIAGAGILAAAGAALFLTRRPRAEPHYCPYCDDYFTTYEELLAHLAAEHPTAEEIGRIQGSVLDAVTGSKVANAKISVNDVFHCFSGAVGFYRTDYIPYGSLEIKVEADNYDTATFPIVLEVGLMDLNLELQPVAEAPTDWTEGIEIREIEVPPIVYLGETAKITVRIVYLHPLPLPADIHGTVLVDGERLTAEWHIDFRNPALDLSYTASQLGNFVAKALDKTASFTVVDNVASTYYMPYGGTRMPICTKILIPDVPACRIMGTGGVIEHPGGDLEMVADPHFLRPFFWIPSTYPRDVLLDQAHLARPIEWGPAGADVQTWEVSLHTGTYPSIRVTPIDYTCPTWGSKEELANIICDSRGCSDKDDSTGCPGTGWLDWIIRPAYLYDVWLGGPGVGQRKRRGLTCPYCGKELWGGYVDRVKPEYYLARARALLQHVETSHPDHPLTEPRGL